MPPGNNPKPSYNRTINNKGKANKICYRTKDAKTIYRKIEKKQSMFSLGL